jgi:AcrR family transcriptional regulator
MAAKKSAKKSAPAPESPKLGGPMLDGIVAAGLAETAAVGWTRVVMDAVAARAGMPLGAVLLDVPSKAHLVVKYLKWLDARTVGPVTRLDEADTPRDRLFEIVMRRFDAMNEHRDGARALVIGVSRDPQTAVMSLCYLERSFRAMLEAAGISTGGIVGLVRVQGLKAVLAYALNAWVRDDSDDMAKTMAALDKALDRAESLSRFRMRRPSKGEGETVEP